MIHFHSSQNSKDSIMNYHDSSPDPPRTLAQRLSRLNDNLQDLGERLKASIAGLLGDAIAEAVRDSVRGLLGGREALRDPYSERRDHHARDNYGEPEDDPWGDEDRRWREEEDCAPARRMPAARSAAGHRWRDAVGAAVRAALWFLKRQPRRRPVLTTLCVTLAAGVTGFVAGPLLAAGAGVLASVAGLVFTADAYQSAAELAAG
jgi:hypothetical protein